MRCRRCCQTNRYADGHVAASRLTRSGTLPTHANGQGKSRKRLEQESLGATGMLWLLLQCGCCYSAGTNIAVLLLLGAKRGQKYVFSRVNTATFFRPRISPNSCDRPTECTECCNHVCSECLVALPRPIGANADLIDDYYGFYTCCLCCSA